MVTQEIKKSPLFRDIEENQIESLLDGLTATMITLTETTRLFE